MLNVKINAAIYRESPYTILNYHFRCLNMNELRPKLQEALSQLASPLAKLMTEICLDPHFNATLSSKQFAQIMRATTLSDEALRLALLPVAAAYAVAPISQFYVGAIARGNSGRLYFGANMEFTQQGLSNAVHAEQSAISHAWLNGEQYIEDITINYSPCGHCRQFLNELNQAEHLNIQLPDQAPQKLSQYLPSAFGPQDLNITQRLMSAQHHNIEANIKGILFQEALSALNQSYAPYSNHFSAVILQSKTGVHYQGRYAENAAFNPSLAPLNMALNSLNLANGKLNEIKQAILIEMKDSAISHLDNTKALLHSINPDISLHYYNLHNQNAIF